MDLLKYEKLVSSYDEWCYFPYKLASSRISVEYFCFGGDNFISQKSF